MEDERRYGLDDGVEWSAAKRPDQHAYTEGEDVDFVLYDTPEQGMALVIEGPATGFRIGGPDLYGQQYEVVRFAVDERARGQILRRLREQSGVGDERPEVPTWCPKCGRRDGTCTCDPFRRLRESVRRLHGMLDDLEDENRRLRTALRKLEGEDDG